jgi:hypothetical protein
VAVHHPRLRQVRAEGHSVGLRLLSDHRDDLTEERTRTGNPGARSHHKNRVQVPECHTPVDTVVRLTAVGQLRQSTDQFRGNFADQSGHYGSVGHGDAHELWSNRAAHADVLAFVVPRSYPCASGSDRLIIRQVTAARR